MPREKQVKGKICIRGDTIHSITCIKSNGSQKQKQKKRYITGPLQLPNPIPKPRERSA